MGRDGSWGQWDLNPPFGGFILFATRVIGHETVDFGRRLEGIRTLLYKGSKAVYKHDPALSPSGAITHRKAGKLLRQFSAHPDIRPIAFSVSKEYKSES
jgi:hypothetical protein